jgi:hypothetical protein
LPCGGLHILGLFPRVVGGYRYLYVDIDKFTKWLEATPVVKINKQSAVKFIKLIVYRFRVLNRIITDNETQFTNSVSRLRRPRRLDLLRICCTSREQWTSREGQC